MVLGLFWGNSFVFGSDIPSVKEKKLQCLHKDKRKTHSVKHDYLYILFSSNDNKAKFIRPITSKQTKVFDFNQNVYLYLTEIHFGGDRTFINWVLDRKTGALSETHSGLKKILYGKCEPLTEDFDPYEYMKAVAKQNLERTKKELKF